jgi:hypothetical protein
MPFDVLDQETVKRLPRLSELHDAYGVQVNSITVDELFDLYERTGFLYPDKAARLRPYMGQVKENWRRMFEAGESLLYVLTAGDEKQGHASLAVFRTTYRGWTFQHLVSEDNPFASRAVMLAAEAASILKGSEESAQNWFRPENRFPARVFGSMIQAIGGSLSSAQNHAYFGLPRKLSLPSDSGIRIVPYEAAYNRDLCSLAEMTRGQVYVTAEELATDVTLKSLDMLYRRVDLRRSRHVWLAYRQNQPVGAALAYRGPLGLNFSFLENRCDLLLAPDLDQTETQRVAAGLLGAAVTAYDTFELDFIPLIAGEFATPVLVNLGAQFVRHYCQCIWLKGGYARSYRHVDSFYSKVLDRAKKRTLLPSFLLESSHESK